MHNTNDNIDLDALFDMLNIVDTSAGKAAADVGKTFSSQLDPNIHAVPDLSPLGTDYFTIDLPVDQS